MLEKVAIFVCGVTVGLSIGGLLGGYFGFGSAIDALERLDNSTKE